MLNKISDSDSDSETPLTFVYHRICGCALTVHLPTIVTGIPL